MIKDANGLSNIIILTACDDDEQSSESAILCHGEFTYCLLQGLQSSDTNNNGNVSAEDAFSTRIQHCPNTQAQPIIRNYMTAHRVKLIYSNPRLVELSLSAPLILIGFIHFTSVIRNR
jgi:uncharacterized caspase-like protein